MASEAFKKAWEKHTGLDYAPEYSGAYHESMRDFQAGWDACHKLLCKCWVLLPDMENSDILEIKQADPY